MWRQTGKAGAREHGKAGALCAHIALAWEGGCVHAGAYRASLGRRVRALALAWEGGCANSFVQHYISLLQDRFP